MKWNSLLPGILFTILIALGALLLSELIPFGAVSIAIILGIILGNSITIQPILQNGIAFSEKHLLSFAIAFMGVKLDFTILQDLGITSLLFIIIALTLTILSSLLLAKLFHFDKKFALLLGIGNGVCGSSAIAATEGIIDADEEEVGLSIAIVNFLGTIGIFLAPLLATTLLHFSDFNAGLFIGNTLQAVGQVMAASASISEEAKMIATVVKMTRILMLLPLVFILIGLFKKSKGNSSSLSTPKVPLFIIGFALFSLIPTFHILPQEVIHIISLLSHYLLIIAMAGVGLKITFKSILQNGQKALLIGILIWGIQLIFSGIMITTLY